MNGTLAYFQHQALFLWLVLAAGWTLSGLNRRRERLRRLAAAKAASSAKLGNATCTGTTSSSHDASAIPNGSNGSGAPDAADIACLNGGVLGGAAGGNAARDVLPHLLPPVSVVMPVKGCRPHSRTNWESQLGLQYGGPLEFVFVVEAEDDPAVSPLRELCSRVMRAASAGAAEIGSQLESVRGGPSGVSDRSGPGFGNGSGCQAGSGNGNLLGGRRQWLIEGGDQRSVRLVVAGFASSCSQKAHNLCAGIESCDPRVARERGYVLCLDDDVALHPGTLEELVAELEARPDVFMATGYPFDVPPPGASLPAYLALTYHLPLLIAFSAAPNTAFVWGGCMLLRGDQLLPDDPGGLLASWRHGGYSDDLILASYCTERGLRILVPPFAIFPQRLDPRMSWAAWLNYLHRQLFVLDTYTNDHNRRTNHTMMVLHSLLSWLLVLPSVSALCMVAQRLTTAATAIVGAAVAAAAASASSSAEWQQVQAALQTLLQLPGGVLAVAAGWAAAHAALVFMTAEILGLFRQLSPPMDTATATATAPHIPISWFRWGRLWLGLMLSNAVLPLVMLYTYLHPQVEWGAVVYRKHRGRVAPVRRKAV